MLAAHLVPGYFAATRSQKFWNPQWTRTQRAALWTVAFASTVAPDSDVIYNTLFRGFTNHGTLWTHSLFVHLGICFVWLILYRVGRWRYLQILVGLVALGGLSHLALDTIAHGTMLLYPVSHQMFGVLSARVLDGGFWAYISDPIFLAEPFLFALAVGDWIIHRQFKPQVKRLAFIALTTSWVMFSAGFIFLLPTLQSIAAAHGVN